jgi:starch synthase
MFRRAAVLRFGNAVAGRSAVIACRAPAPTAVCSRAGCNAAQTRAFTLPNECPSVKSFSAPLRILFVAAECAPLVKTGGLGDVAAALPAALRRLGLDARLLLPAYAPIKAGLRDVTRFGRLAPLAELPAADLIGGLLPDGVPVIAVDCPALYERTGGPYQGPDGTDWPDNALRFGLLGRAAAWIAAEAGDRRADVLHLNDWHAGLAAAYARFSSRPRTPVLFTAHNLAFAGTFDAPWLSRLGLPPQSWSIEGLEYYGQLSFLKAGLHYADAITTGSPTYAREIQSAPRGMGFEGLLAARRGVLHGILNGIDTALWDPRTDPLIVVRYDADSLPGKAVNKHALQQRCALATDARIPLFAAVSRLTDQKGTDLIAALAAELIESPAQLLVVGTGERAFEERLRTLAAQHPGRIAVHIGFDEALAHLAEAGADIFLMPSRFEPCGLNQMYSQRYGTVPIVSATGGLADSVVDCTETTLADGTATGFQFTPIDAAGLRGAITRALIVYRAPDRWRGLQLSGMSRDFGWARSAREYAQLYAQIAGGEAAA